MNAFTTVVRPGLLGKTHQGKNMTFAVKASIGCGFPASASTPSLRDWIPKDYSPVVRSLVDSGHEIVAMANMHELAFGVTSENPGYGDVDNPRKQGFIPGGSSGGSAAAVAMNAVSFALGTDTGGSMRIPASLCGVVGYRPTTGLYGASVVFPISSTMDTIGIFAQKVVTVQQAHKAVVPSYIPDVRPLKGVRFGVPRKYFYSVLDSEVSQVTETALKLLQGAEVDLIEVDFPSEFAEDLLTACFDLAAFERHRLIPKYLEEQGAPVTPDELLKGIGDPIVKEILRTSGKISEERYRQCQEKVESVCKQYDEYFKANNLEAFVCPTTILPALKRPTPENVHVAGQEFPTMLAYTYTTYPQSIAGVPCISIPSGLTCDGLPVGLQLVAPRNQDSNLLGLAASVQAELPSLPQIKFTDFKDKL